MPKVSIIILNWNSYNDTVECLRSLNDIGYPNYHLILVDNGSSNGSANKFKATFPEIDLIINKSNLGFAAGNNVGIKYSMEKGADYVLLLNNDTVVEAGFLTELLKAADADPKIGIIGPKILFYDSKIVWFAGGYLDKKTGFVYHRGEGETDRAQYNSLAEIDFASGCAMLIKREVFLKIGYLDEDYYHSHEDADFCLRAKTAGYKIVYAPQAVIYHKLAQASGGRRSPFYLYYRTRNHLLFKYKLKLEAPLFWPMFIFLFSKRILGSLFLGSPKGALAALQGVFDFYAKKWGRGSGDKFR